MTFVVLNRTDVTARAPIHIGEENVMQGEIDMASLGARNAEVAPRIVDEPLTVAEVNALADMFIA